ncbi:MAG TPA: C-GCAxxG-C-C family protein [Anaeromyxobacter sp.]|nr:C-GCAxxG-C-C family protein [Anaeromyxobacter sp.]
MRAEEVRSMELALQGFGCSQILLLLELEREGKTSPELVRAVSGLHGGLGFTGKICGALSGGCCALALHLGRGTPEETEDPGLNPAIRCLVEWFEAEVGKRYGGSECSNILAGDPRARLSRCPQIIGSVHEKVQQILGSRS